MTWKQIEASREARLWVSQIVVPTVTVVATALAIPGVKDAIAEKIENVKRSAKEKFKRN